MTKFYAMIVSAVFLAAASSAPARALDNPIVIDLHGSKGAARAASATIFGSGPTVLVNVTAGSTIPAGAAITLNGGDCANPGTIAFALSGIDGSQSMTKLEHSLADIAGKAKSLVIHQTASETSPAVACGKVTG